MRTSMQEERWAQGARELTGPAPDLHDALMAAATLPRQAFRTASAVQVSGRGQPLVATAWMTRSRSKKTEKLG
jgi:hypothetical protein